MAAATYPLVIEAGATFKLSVMVRGGTGADAPAMDLTGWTPRLQIREVAGDLGVLLDCRPDNDRLKVSDAAAGRLSMVVLADDTSTLEFTSAVYDLIITHTTGEVRRLLQGTATLSPAVTR